MNVFKVVVAFLSGWTAWYLAQSLSSQELHIVIAAGVMLAATALGVTVSAGTTLMLLMQKLNGANLSRQRFRELQTELWRTTFLFFPGLVLAVISVVVAPSWLTPLVVIDCVILGFGYAHLISSARLFYAYAQGR